MRRFRTKVLAALVLAANVSLLPLSEAVPDFNVITAEAHSGRTDANGGHHDYKNKSGLGSYHYHHGYPAHLHPNGVCPYSGGSAGSSSGGSGATGSASTSASSSQNAEAALDYSLVFDASYYAEHNSDVAAACGSDSSALLNHFVNNGMAEGRQGCETFNVNVYKDNNPDLVSVYGDDLKSYYIHYINCGHNEGRTCC